MFGGTYKSAVEELIESQVRRDMEFRNSLQGKIIEQHLNRKNDPVYQMMIRASKDAAARAKERGLWFYRRTTGIITRDIIRKAVHKLLEQLFPKKFDPESFANRIRAALSTQDNCDGIVKVHSPPVRLIPKTLHPIDSVA
jgi:hypothetical protein